MKSSGANRKQRGIFSYNTQLNCGTPCHRLVRTARSSHGFKELPNKNPWSQEGKAIKGTKHKKYHFFVRKYLGHTLLATGRL